MALSTKALTTVANVKTYLDISDTSQDTKIEQLINSVSDDIASRCNRVFLSAERTEKLTGNGRQTLLLTYYPITDVKSVTVDSAALTEGTDFDVLADEGSLFKVNGVWTKPEVNQVFRPPYIPEIPYADENSLKHNIEAVYTAGYILPYQASSGETPVVPTLPYDLEMACIKMIAADINRKGSEHEKSENLGPLQSAFLDNDYSDSVLSVLERYKRPVIV